MARHAKHKDHPRADLRVLGTHRLCCTWIESRRLFGNWLPLIVWRQDELEKFVPAPAKIAREQEEQDSSLEDSQEILSPVLLIWTG